MFEIDSVSVPETWDLEIRGAQGDVVATLTDRNALWSFICRRLTTLLNYLGAESQQVRAFSARYLFPREHQLGFDAIAIAIGKSDKTAKRYVYKVRHEIEQEFQRCGLLPDPNDANTER